jgi:hypothetical protein
VLKVLTFSKIILANFTSALVKSGREGTFIHADMGSFSEGKDILDTTGY